MSDEQITEAARACFLEQGPQAPVEAVAARLGVTPAALLRRFGSKEALLRRALLPGDPPRSLEGAPEARRPVPEQLVELLLEVLADVRQTIPRIATLRASGLPLVKNPRPQRMRRSLATWLERAGKDGRVADRDYRAAADALLGAIDSRAWQEYHARKPATRNDRAWVTVLVDTLWTGLTPARGIAHR